MLPERTKPKGWYEGSHKSFNALSEKAARASPTALFRADCQLSRAVRAVEGRPRGKSMRLVSGERTLPGDSTTVLSVP